ncbi:MAG: HAD family phosphatase [Proteobacteria bacterium]|nr:HAD family phosphatase [Pseudomonadota bacterium]
MTLSPLTSGSADALLFDLGRVVLELDTARTMACWARHAGCEASEIVARFKIDDASRQYESGKIDTAAYFASLRTLLGADLTEAQLLEGWNAMFVGAMPGMTALLARAAQRVPLYALSNTNPAHETYFLQNFPDTLGHFRAIYTSSTIGLLKPDAKAYHHAIAAIGVPTKRIVFFDDLLANVEAARSCGLTAVHVRTTSDVEDALAALEI